MIKHLRKVLLGLLVIAQPVLATTKTDDFNRANEATLGAPWETISAFGLRLNTNRVDASSSVSGNMSGWLASDYTFANDQTSQITITIIGSGDHLGPCVRMTSGSGGNGYCIYYNAGDLTLYFIRVTAGAATTLIHPAVTFAAGDALKLDVTGTTLTGYINGVSVGSTTDATYSSGQPGLIYNWGNVRATKGDDFVATDAVSSSSQAPRSIYYRNLSTMNPASEDIPTRTIK